MLFFSALMVFFGRYGIRIIAIKVCMIFHSINDIMVYFKCRKEVSVVKFGAQLRAKLRASITLDINRYPVSLSLYRPRIRNACI